MTDTNLDTVEAINALVRVIKATDLSVEEADVLYDAIGTLAEHTGDADANS